MTDKADWFATK